MKHVSMSVEIVDEYESHMERVLRDYAADKYELVAVVPWKVGAPGGPKYALFFKKVEEQFLSEEPGDF